jgi:hypothetical protein
VHSLPSLGLTEETDSTRSEGDRLPNTWTINSSGMRANMSISPVAAAADRSATEGKTSVVSSSESWQDEEILLSLEKGVVR